jgi:hypothetical protein
VLAVFKDAGFSDAVDVGGGIIVRVDREDPHKSRH